MREAIQIIQMLALPPSSPPPPRQWRVFSVPREWCQHGPLKTAAVRSEMNALAEHNGPNLNTTRIYARSEPQQKKEGYSAPIQPCCYFIRAVNLLQPFIPFVVFKCLWSLKHVDDPTGAAPVFFWMGFDSFFCVVGSWTERRGLCVCVWPQIYTDWANHYLAKSGHKRLIKDLQTDVTDGVLLAEIIQVVGKRKNTRLIPEKCAKGKPAVTTWNTSPLTFKDVGDLHQTKSGDITLK